MDVQEMSKSEMEKSNGGGLTAPFWRMVAGGTTFLIALPITLICPPAGTPLLLGSAVVVVDSIKDI